MIRFQSIRTLLAVWAPLALLVLCGNAASAAAPAQSATHTTTIEIMSFAYAPRAITIAVGTTVIWRNHDLEPHTVRGSDELLRSGALDQDETYSVRFDKPGTYHYGCSIHPQMSGTITVQ